jgi:hypothetical protein
VYGPGLGHGQRLGQPEPGHVGGKEDIGLAGHCCVAVRLASLPSSQAASIDPLPVDSNQPSSNSTMRTSAQRRRSYSLGNHGVGWQQRANPGPGVVSCVRVRDLTSIRCQ